MTKFWKDNGTTCQHYSQDREAGGRGISHDCGHVDRFYLSPRLSSGASSPHTQLPNHDAMMPVSSTDNMAMIQR